MRITTLDMTTFLAHPQLHLQLLPKKVSVFVGLNGSGKSTLLDALKVALTGTAREVARKDADALATWGASTWSVSTTLSHLDADGKVLRTPGKLYAMDEDGVRHSLTQTKLNDALLGGEPKVVDALFDVWRALDMTPDDRRALVCQVAGITTDEEFLVNQGLTLAEANAQAVQGNWKKAEATCAELKRELRRAAEEIRGQAPTDSLVGAEGYQMRCSEVSDDVLADCKASAAEARQKEAEALRLVGAAEGRSEAQLQAVRDQVTAMEEDLQAMLTEEALRTEQATLEKAQQDAREIVEACNTGIEEELAKLRTIQQAANPLEARLKVLKNWQQQCTCTQCGVVHDRPDAPSESEGMDVEAGLAKLREEWKEQNEVVQQGKAMRKEHQEDLETAGYNLQACQAKLKARSDLEANLATQRTSVAEVPKVEDMEAEVAKWKARADLAEGIATMVDAYRTVLAGYTNQAQRRDQLLERADDLQEQEYLCRPDGLQAALLRNSVQPIQDAMLKASEVLFGEAEQVVAATINDDFEPLVVDANGEAHPAGTLNGSVRWRTGLCLAHALAQISGLRILLLDEVTLLDQHNQQALLMGLCDLAEYYDQVLVCSTPNGITITGAPDDMDLALYHVRPGQVRYLPAGTTVNA